MTDCERESRVRLVGTHMQVLELSGRVELEFWNEYHDCRSAMMFSNSSSCHSAIVVGSMVFSVPRISWYRILMDSKAKPKHKFFYKQLVSGVHGAIYIKHQWS